MRGEIVGYVEAAMPWLLVIAPLALFLIKGSSKQRCGRALAAFLVVLLVGFCAEVEKLRLSAERAASNRIKAPGR
jgi:hypothetical protein